MLNNKGFTLVESLLVVSIIVMTSVLSFNYHIPVNDNQDIINKIEAFLYEAKMNSIIKKEKTKIILSDNKIEYHSNSLSKDITINSFECEDVTFTYNLNGNIYKAQSIDIYINNELYEIVFQVGSGCFEVRS